MQLTSLETGFQHVWWNGNCPVEDPSQAPSKEDPRRTEVTHTVAGLRKKKKSKKKKKSSKNSSALTKVTAKEAAWLTATRQHNAAVQIECSIWARFPRISTLWAKRTNSTLKVQTFSFSSTHTQMLWREKNHKQMKKNQNKNKPKTPTTKTPSSVHTQVWKWRDLL